MQISLQRILQEAQIQFIPNEQQVDAIEKITTFFDGKGTFDEFVLMGYAGTGKTSIVRILLAYARLRGYYNDIAVTAPTHRAKAVIAKIAGKPGTTLHKILGMRPDVVMDNLDMRELKFNAKLIPALPFRGILIVDESSMVHDELDRFIQEKCMEYQTRILYIGDPAQLKPVKQDTISKVFEIQNNVELTKVERQQDDNPLGPILDAIRNNSGLLENPFTKHTVLNEQGKGLHCTSSAPEFFHLLSKEYKALFEKDTSSVKMLAYTNDKVKTYNIMIRRALGFKNQNLMLGDILMAYDNLKSDVWPNLCEIYNSSDYEIVDIYSQSIIREGITMHGDYMELKALGDSDGEFNQKVFLIDKDTDEETLIEIGRVMEQLREDGILNGGRAWRPYFEFKGSFATWKPIIYDGRLIKGKTFDYGYATTIHKSQGGTYHTVFVDDRDIDICQDPEVKNQLKYVALSRPTEKAVLFS